MPRLPVGPADGRAIVAYLRSRTPAPPPVPVARCPTAVAWSGAGRSSRRRGVRRVTCSATSTSPPARAWRCSGPCASGRCSPRTCASRASGSTRRSRSPGSRSRPRNRPGDADAAPGHLGRRRAGRPGLPVARGPWSARSPAAGAVARDSRAPVASRALRRRAPRLLAVVHPLPRSHQQHDRHGGPRVPAARARFVHARRRAGGLIGPDGVRRSIVATAGQAPPILLQRLLRRWAEAPRDLVRAFRDPLGPGLRARGAAELPGMPLGLPPLSAGELRLVGAWIAQGTPP